MRYLGVRRNNLARWWFSNISFYFHPYLERWSNLTSIFFKWGGSKPPTSLGCVVGVVQMGLILQASPGMILQVSVVHSTLEIQHFLNPKIFPQWIEGKIMKKHEANHRLFGFKMFISPWKRKNLSPEKKGMNLSKFALVFGWIWRWTKKPPSFGGFQPLNIPGAGHTFPPTTIFVGRRKSRGLSEPRSCSSHRRGEIDEYLHILTLQKWLGFHPKWWFYSRGNDLISGKPRLVKYHN